MQSLEFEIPTIFGLARLQKFCTENGFAMPLLVIDAQHVPDLQRPEEDRFINVYVGGFYDPQRRIGLFFETTLPVIRPSFTSGSLWEMSNSSTHFYAVAENPFGEHAEYFKWFEAYQKKIGMIGHWGKEDPTVWERIICLFSPKRYIKQAIA